VLGVDVWPGRAIRVWGELLCPVRRAAVLAVGPGGRAARYGALLARLGQPQREELAGLIERCRQGLCPQEVVADCLAEAMGEDAAEVADWPAHLRAHSLIEAWLAYDHTFWLGDLAEYPPDNEAGFRGYGPVVGVTRRRVTVKGGGRRGRLYCMTLDDFATINWNFARSAIDQANALLGWVLRVPEQDLP
jgi:hypothetical protein